MPDTDYDSLFSRRRAMTELPLAKQGVFELTTDGSDYYKTERWYWACDHSRPGDQLKADLNKMEDRGYEIYGIYPFVDEQGPILTIVARMADPIFDD